MHTSKPRYYTYATGLVWLVIDRLAPEGQGILMVSNSQLLADCLTATLNQQTNPQPPALATVPAYPNGRWASN